MKPLRTLRTDKHTLLGGKAYTPAHMTDIAATFDRVNPNWRWTPMRREQALRKISGGKHD